jgi:hypothetical protein
MSTVKFLAKTYALEVAPNAPQDAVVLSSMSGAELLGLHNLVASNLGRGAVKRFSDTETARRRTWAILDQYAKTDELGSEDPAKDDAAQETAEAAPEEPKAKKPKAPKKARGPRYVFAADDTIKPVKPNTARGKALELLLRPEGATQTEVEAVTGWNKKQAYEGIRLIHYYSGYGLRQDDGEFSADTTRIYAYKK